MNWVSKTQINWFYAYAIDFTIHVSDCILYHLLFFVKVYLYQSVDCSSTTFSWLEFALYLVVSNVANLLDNVFVRFFVCLLGFFGPRFTSWLMIKAGGNPVIVYGNLCDIVYSCQIKLKGK